MLSIIFFHVVFVGVEGMEHFVCLGPFSSKKKKKSTVETCFDFCLLGNSQELLCEQSMHTMSSSCVVTSAFYHCS